jgi:cell division septation protein DedD
LGNIGDMPKVYSVRNRQPAPGVPITPENAGFVVVKYRVIVVATDNTQQEQLRAIVPDAFPAVYRGQRVMQAGAFGDRSKANELVASLNVQGLQAIIEPLR